MRARGKETKYPAVCYLHTQHWPCLSWCQLLYQKMWVVPLKPAARSSSQYCTRYLTKCHSYTSALHTRHNTVQLLQHKVGDFLASYSQSTAQSSSPLITRLEVIQQQTMTCKSTQQDWRIQRLDHTTFDCKCNFCFNVLPGK